MATYWTPQGLQQLAQSESGGRASLIHYPSGKPSTASGLYGFLDSTWREQSANVPGASQYSRAAFAPASVQTAVAAQTPTSHWTCPGCNSTANELVRDPSNVTGNPMDGGFTTSNDTGITNENFGTTDFASGTPLETSLGTDGTISDNTATASDTTPSIPFGDAEPGFGGYAGGLAFHPVSGPSKETLVTGVSVAKNAILAGVPDVTKALGGVGAAIDGVGSTFASWISQGIAAAEETVGRSMVMLLAIVLVLAAAWLLVPRGTKEAVVATAARAV